MARKTSEDPQLDLTPMIDVVFELIIFFVVTIKQQDILSRLNVNRPAPASSAAEQDTENKPLEIEIGGLKTLNPDRPKAGYVVQQVPRNLKYIEDEILKPIAEVGDKDKLIVISCATDSPHVGLVDLLDVCYKYKLYNVNVFTK